MRAEPGRAASLGAARFAALTALSLAAPGCGAFPGAAAAGRRFLDDAYVVVTSPLQIPAMAGRDAWDAVSGEEADSKAWLPVYFVGYTLLHTGLSSLHLLDLVATPVHLVAGNGPAKIYVASGLPMQLDPTGDLGHEAGEMALYGAGTIGGAAIAWWLTTYYVPNIFRWFS